ncbi:MAG: type IX secretion system membrane protein PorP/SprF [Bacteroidota bacterium]|nr:type IX secretion system membrane protein PorP/SprF [Bacteroidota bacterium]
MNKFYLALFLLLPCFSFAQNDFQFSHFMYNESVFNPAAAGNSDKIITSLTARQQWIGVDNPPSSQFLNAHTYIDKIKGGIGLALVNDRVGFENTLNFKLNYSYHLRLSELATLSAGLSAGFINKKLDGSKLVYEQGGDPFAIVNGTSVFKPDFGFGMEFNMAKFTTGISSTHINNALKTSTIFNNPRHYFLYAKYKISAGDDFLIIPAVLLKSSEFIHQYELNTNVVYLDKFRLGVTYRYKESIVGLIGMDITDELRIGYSYDFNAQPVRSYSSGSHEIMLMGTFKGFNTKKYNYKSPRFFN